VPWRWFCHQGSFYPYRLVHEVEDPDGRPWSPLVATPCLVVVPVEVCYRPCLLASGAPAPKAVAALVAVPVARVGSVPGVAVRSCPNPSPVEASEAVEAGCYDYRPLTL